VLRERTSALQMSNIEWAKAFFSDAPPAKLALYAPSTAVPPPVEVAGLKPFLNLLKMNDPGLRGLLQDWLHNVYTADDAAEAFADRAKLPAGGCIVTRQGTSSRRAACASMLPIRAGRHAGPPAGNRQHHQAAARSRCWPTKARALGARRSRRQELTRRLTEYRAKLQSLQSSVHTLQIEVVKLTEIEARFNQRSTQIETDLAEIAAQEEEQTQVKLESEEKFEQLDMELGNLQGDARRRPDRFMEKEQRWPTPAKLRDLERGAGSPVRRKVAAQQDRGIPPQYRHRQRTGGAGDGKSGSRPQELASLEQGRPTPACRTAGPPHRRKSAVRCPPRTGPDCAAAAHVRRRPHVDRARLQPQRDKIMECSSRSRPRA
jgi:chromosome segregation protein